MKTLTLTLITLITMATQSSAQESVKNLPYYQIPDYPQEYTSNTVAARMIDGLGYRYYWATEGLREEDLAFRPSETSRTTRETIEHIYGLSRTIANAPQKKINSSSDNELSFEEIREQTLWNIQLTSTLLKAGKEEDMVNYNMIFKRGESTVVYPFWNLINGPIADVIYHTGQVVAFRRASGNPIHPGVRVLIGKTSE